MGRFGYDKKHSEIEISAYMWVWNLSLLLKFDGQDPHKCVGFGPQHHFYQHRKGREVVILLEA